MSLWDLAQQSQMRAIRHSQLASETESFRRDQRQDQRVDDVEDQLTRLADLVQALWEVVKVRTGTTEDDLSAAVAEIMERREALQRPVPCPSCQAAVVPAVGRCQFCGTVLPTPGTPSGPPVAF